MKHTRPGVCCCLQHYREGLWCSGLESLLGTEAARTLRTGRLCLHEPVGCGQQELVNRGQLRYCQLLEVLCGSGWTAPSTSQGQLCWDKVARVGLVNLKLGVSQQYSQASLIMQALSAC